MSLWASVKYGPALCVRVGLPGHVFGPNIWDKGAYGKRRLLWAKHWRY